MADGAIRNAVHCRDCAALISPTATTCPHCGGQQGISSGHARLTPSGKSRLAAALLALLLGAIGAHKFYLGRTGWGIVYLIFCWSFVPALAGLIEGILYLTMSDAAFARKYG